MNGHGGTHGQTEEWPTVGRVEGAACGAVGLGLTVVVLTFGYSVVVAVAMAVPLLSTTAIVFTWAFLWLVTWFVLVVGVAYVRDRTGDATSY
ncbi:hypothetical protein [Salinigranum marinum]|uniref:hypothetical protein n=1 Tax=Salinigranum marinum TaxID=1515595 RepID=UPI002989AD07|nr:hypothetical protein [Salinigranum marinum]